MTDMVAVPIFFSKSDMERCFTDKMRWKFSRESHLATLAEKLLLLILKYHHDTTVQNSSDVGVKIRDFTCVKPPNPRWGDALIEISYEFSGNKGWWRQSLHYVADRSGGLSGRLYNRTRIFHEERH